MVDKTQATKERDTYLVDCLQQHLVE